MVPSSTHAAEFLQGPGMRALEAVLSDPATAGPFRGGLRSGVLLPDISNPGGAKLPGQPLENGQR